MLCAPQVNDKRLTSHMQCNGFPRNTDNQFSEGQLIHRPVYVCPENRVSKFTVLPLGHSSDWTSESAATEGFELLFPQPTTVYCSDQPNEKNMQDQDISFKPLPSGHRKKVKNLLTMCPTCHMAANSSSGLDTAPLISESDILHDDDDKPPKRSSKKRRNKWKQFRHATHENINLLPELQHEEQIDVASPVEVLLPDLLADKLSDTSFSASSFVKGTHLGKDNHAEDVTDSSSHTERVQCSSEACSSKMFLPVSSGRSGRRSREISSCNNLTATNRVVGANRQRRSGKDSAVSVWQKVEKLDKEKSSGAGHVVVPALEDTNKGVQHDPDRPMDKHRCKKSCKQHSPDVAVEMGLTTENGALNPCHNFPRCVCNKQTPFLYEQTSSSSKMGSCQSSKNYYAPKNVIPKMPKNQLQPIEGLSMLQLVCASDTIDRPIATGIEKATLAPYNLDPHLVPQAMSKEACSLVIQDDTHFPRLENKATSTDLDSRKLCADPCHAEMEEIQCVKSYSTAVHMPHKWVPLIKKDVIHFDVPEASVVEASVPADVSVSANIDAQSNFPYVPASTKCEGRKIATEVTTKLNSSGQLDSKCTGHTETVTAFSKITEAVSDAHMAQHRAEDIQLLVGRPLADFEQFIYSASPVLHCSSCPTGCNSSQKWVRDRLCFHRTADISLSSIWQWYEEPGCYGLEVKAQDLRRSKGFWSSHYQFNAYFVPYLSAVQLFGQPERTIDKAEANMGARSKTTPCLSSLPILAKLLPQESNEKNSLSALHNKDDQQSETIESIFEFFESEQPFWRRQLFDKVKELIGGAKQSNCRISGDPKNLELKLHDLHPASWYCVAWYPIYRIPDGKFQAAFLTYHSLGHWVHRGSSSDQAVLPVMGLQSYNDKGEWWFETSKSGNPEDAPKSTGSSQNHPPSQVLRERVLTLKQAAAAMARADVPSKDQVHSRNRHPDYEFFLSRHR